ncbi:PQQ-dependent sugar dehydrogenase [Mucilaginibacter calamicampi]|uniref:PQQ-dependent sugar dehydrogenase n=1 Tax=Mucilaginibacter calamicampi TaxID=1302352 RepID=A0ABW2YV19_9SPHI
MKNTAILLLAALCILISCKSNNTPQPDDENANPPALGKYSIVQAFPNMAAITNPIELTAPNDGTNRIFVASVKGTINVFANDATTSAKNVFLDIISKVASGGELGLLGLAFSPDYKTNGYFYVNYTRRNPSLETVIARYKVSAGNPNQADPASEEILITFAQPFENHNGGKLAFGNDGFLYIATGDGGSGGDPNKNGQNNKTLLGKILRIDVSAAGAYKIPADNPFKGNTTGLREEIYAYGMRNPWRFSFDRTTGMLWAADVGQDKTEEIDIIEKGGNYGWNPMEGGDCYVSGCDKTGLTLPIYSYSHSIGSSITGGYVSRDKNLPGLNGRYIYGDYVSGSIWALSNANKTAGQNDLIGKVSGGTLSSFGEDSNNNLYILNYSEGKIYKFVVAP